MTPEQLAPIGAGIKAAAAASEQHMRTAPCWGVIAPATQWLHNHSIIGHIDGKPWRWVVVGGAALEQAMRARAAGMQDAMVVELPPMANLAAGSERLDMFRLAMAAQYPR
jgi:hypothetical protein